MIEKELKITQYYDSRSNFWKKHFKIAYDYTTYLNEQNQNNPEHVSRWIKGQKRTPKLTDEQKQRLKGYNRKLNVLMYCGVWCGDCARQGHLLKQIAEICGSEVELRLIERDLSAELQDELRILGATRVPVVVFLSEDFWEIDRFGDRTLSVYRSMAARQIGRGTDQGILSPTARRRELEGWLNLFERVLIMLRLSPPLRKLYND